MRTLWIGTLVLVGVSLVFGAGVSPAVPPAGLGGDPAASGSPDRMPRGRNQINQEIFFAVLEGLYRDGVDTETAKLLAAVDEKTGAPLHFIYGCPLCMPAFDAVQLYVGRPAFRSSKLGSDTFGSGLSADLRARLHGDDLRTRLDAFQGMIQNWIHDHIDRMRLSPAEHEAWSEAIAGFREKGNAILRSYLDQGGEFAEVYRGWEKCAVCEGSNAAME